MSRTAPNPAARGSTLVLAMVLLAVLSLVGVAAVSLASQERANVGAKAKRDLQVACANAARMVVYAELARYGSGYLASSTAIPSVTLPDGTVLSQQHYDTPAGMTVNQITPARVLPVSSSTKSSGTADLTNSFQAVGTDAPTVQGYEVVAKCTDPKGRQLEVEFVVAFSL
jgi:Tfp pilus assembly protein PilX